MSVKMAIVLFSLKFVGGTLLRLRTFRTSVSS